MTTKDKITEILKNVLIECGYQKAGICLDGRWYALKWGCDTFDHMRDELAAWHEKELETMKATIKKHEDSIVKLAEEL